MEIIDKTWNLELQLWAKNEDTKWRYRKQKKLQKSNKEFIEYWKNYYSIQRSLSSYDSFLTILKNKRKQRK